MDVNWTYCSNHFTTYVSQTMMSYTLNLYSAFCQLHLNETERKKNNMMVSLSGYKTLSTRRVVSERRFLAGDPRGRSWALVEALDAAHVGPLVGDWWAELAGTVPLLRGARAAAERIWNHLYPTQRKGTSWTRLSFSFWWMRSSSRRPDELS